MAAIQCVTILCPSNSHVILTLPYIWGMAGVGRRARRGQACQAWAGVPGVSGGAGWYGSPMRTLHIDQGIYYNRKEKEKHEKRAEPAKPGRTAKPENRSRDS